MLLFLMVIRGITGASLQDELLSRTCACRGCLEATSLFSAVTVCVRGRRHAQKGTSWKGGTELKGLWPVKCFPRIMFEKGKSWPPGSPLCTRLAL